MMAQIAFLQGEHYDGLDDEYTALHDALAQHAIEATRVIWNGDTAPLRAYDAVILQSYSGYHLDINAFHSMLTAFDADPAITVLNSSEIARWNADKTYLRALEDKGHATVPTLWSDLAPAISLVEHMDRQQWDEVVVKPSVSAGAHETKRITRKEAALQQEWYAQCCTTHTVMIQPFLPEIIKEGEWSLLFFNGNYSHTVLKWPGKGDYRVQHVHGGGYEHREPTDAMLQAAQAVLPDLPGQPLYARVDGIIRDGQLFIIEVELIEPFLYLLPHKDAAANFANAVAEQLQAP